MNLKWCIEGDQTSVPAATAIAPVPTAAAPSSATVTAAAVISRMAIPVEQAATVASRTVMAGAATTAQIVQREPAKYGRASQQDQDPKLAFHGPHFSSPARPQIVHCTIAAGGAGFSGIMTTPFIDRSSVIWEIVLHGTAFRAVSCSIRKVMP
jgi:hypothetical protein